MAASVNKVILVGNLGKDPEIRYLESGVGVANFPMATSETYKDRTTGERVTQTEWHNIVLWRGLAEITEKYLRKGHQVYIEGKLRTRNWQDKDGNQRYTTEVIADNMVMMSKPAGADAAEPLGTASQTSSNPVSSGSGNHQNPVESAPDFTDDNSVDDLPF